MSRPTPISGFPELLPAERNAELAVIDRLRRVFELHGYAGIETRVVEPLDRLVKGGEIDKEVYVLRRLQADDDDPSDTGLGLHYDLTVPFARYVLENAGKLEFPFRRYQIQKAWRGERPQEGRFREFTQADIDVVMKDELPFHFEVEVARVMADALSELPLPPMRMRVNNRKLIQGFYHGIGCPTRRRSSASSTSWTSCRRDRGRLLVDDAGLRRRSRRSSAWRWPRSPAPTPRSSSGSRALGVEHELLDDRPDRAGGGDRGVRRVRVPGSASRRVSAWLVVSTTTPGPCSRSTWRASSSSSPWAAAVGMTRWRLTARRRTQVSVSRSAYPAPCCR